MSLNAAGVAGASTAAVAKLPCKNHFEIVIGIYVRFTAIGMADRRALAPANR